VFGNNLKSECYLVAFVLTQLSATKRNQ